MSLDFSLKDAGRYGEYNLFTVNITHNLGKMAAAAGIYKHLWRPEELDPPVTRAGDLIGPLKEGLRVLLENESEMRVHSPANGWGSYTGFCINVRDVLAACETYPEATVHVCR